jgi:glycosyltransferase involved in cell wall biosynthesis
MRVTCYMNMPSHYQAAFYRELSQLCDLQVIYTSEIPKERQALGWDSDLKGYRSSNLNDLTIGRRMSLEKGPFHFLAGLPGGFGNLTRVLQASDRGNLATQTEMPVPEVASTLWRTLASVYIRFLGTRQIPVLGIGAEVRKFLDLMRFPRELTFPFGYFPEVSLGFDSKFLGPIVYVGQLVDRKGVDILIQAFARSKSGRSRGLIIVGDGKLRPALEELAVRNGVNKDISFLGAMKTSDAHRIMASGSCLVLPSRFDGWGVVINEAISLGLPVIVSHRCGAAELAEHGQCGLIFESESVQQLATELDGLLGSRQAWDRNSGNALKYASRITARSGAEYFLAIVKYVRSGYLMARPLAPWL